MDQMTKDFEIEMNEIKKELDLANEAVELAKRDGYLESDKDNSDPDQSPKALEEAEQVIQEVGEQLGLTLPSTEEDTEMNDNVSTELLSPNTQGSRHDIVIDTDRKTDGPGTPELETLERQDSNRLFVFFFPSYLCMCYICYVYVKCSIVDNARSRSETTVLKGDKTETENPQPVQRSQTARLSQESVHTKNSSVVIRGVAHHRKKSTLSNRGKAPPAATKAWWKYLSKKSEESENFGLEQYAQNWSPEEVAFWLRKVGFEIYAKQFVEDNVNGEVLLNDLNPTVMTQDLKVKPLHCGRLLRHVEKLKAVSSSNISFFFFSLCDFIYNVYQKYEAIQTALQENEKKFEVINLYCETDFFFLTHLRKSNYKKKKKKKTEKRVQMEQENTTLKSEIEKLEKQVQETKSPEENGEDLNKPEATPDPQEQERRKWPKEIQKLMKDLTQK
ncbi:hypothetical protein RFI_06679, partial [Reticulomyxa filosa]